MNQETLQKLKENLNKDKEQTEKELESFSTKSKDRKDDWNTKFPRYSDGGSHDDLDIAAEEVEDYFDILPLEYVLEVRLKNINSALEKINKNKYGFCEKCRKEIPIERLMVSPESRYCIDCKKTTQNK